MKRGAQSGAEMVSAFEGLAAAALDREPISGRTHNFYRYPAPFSPQFAASAIKGFSHPGDLVLDPYMGGGTTVVEAVAAGRHVVGNDLNSLAAFVAQVKVTPLRLSEEQALLRWSRDDVPEFTYRVPAADVADFVDDENIRNLSLVRARFIKKTIAVALASIARLPTSNARRFARCALLRVAQWALDGRSKHTRLTDFRQKLSDTAVEMLDALGSLAQSMAQNGGKAEIFNHDAAMLPETAFRGERRAALVVTSPPYPGVHVLYHRWQVDGRRETPAPYWIAGCEDGQGAAYYTFGERREVTGDRYFQTSLRTLRAIRRVLSNQGHLIQLVAFNRPDTQLPRYLKNMSLAGFAEVSSPGGRIWREVPNRKWHARLRGQTDSAREVVLVHRPE